MTPDDNVWWSDADRDAHLEFSHGRHVNPELLAAGPQPTPTPTPRIEIHAVTRAWSVLREDFGPSGDIDMRVAFSGRTPGSPRRAQMVRRSNLDSGLNVAQRVGRGCEGLLLGISTWRT